MTNPLAAAIVLLLLMGRCTASWKITDKVKQLRVREEGGGVSGAAIPATTSENSNNNNYVGQYEMVELFGEDGALVPLPDKYGPFTMTIDGLEEQGNGEYRIVVVIGNILRARASVEETGRISIGPAISSTRMRPPDPVWEIELLVTPILQGARRIEWDDGNDDDERALTISGNRGSLVFRKVSDDT